MLSIPIRITLNATQSDLWEAVAYALDSEYYIEHSYINSRRLVCKLLEHFHSGDCPGFEATESVKTAAANVVKRYFPELQDS